MGVKVKQLAIAGEGAPVTSFSDTFIRADQPFYLGENWYTILLPTESAGITGPVLAGQINVAGGTNAQLGTGGGGFTSSNGTCVFIPRPLDFSAVSGKAMFSQFEALGHTGDINFGPGVFLNPNASSAHYVADWRLANTLELWRGIDPFTTLVAAIATGAPPVTLRLEVRPSSSSNELRMLVNGAVISTFTDSNAARPTTGMPGIVWWGNAINVSGTFRNYSCGLL